MPLVDVAIATYNQETFIAQCLESILDQQTDFDYRIIISEDCSTDRTREIIEYYASLYSDIITPFYQQKNKGIKGPDSNGIFALKKCRAKYIALCDGDDYWTDNNKLQKQVNYLEHNSHISGCFHNSITVDENGNILRRQYFLPKQRFYDQHAALTSLGSSYATSSLVFRSQIYRNLPDWYLHNISDFTLDLLITEYGDLAYLDNNMSAYRIHAGGIWQGSSEADNRNELISRLQGLYAHEKFRRIYGEFLKRKINELAAAL